MRKSDITYHADGFERAKPAVNVKIHFVRSRDMTSTLATFHKNELCDHSPSPQFTEAWIDANISEDTQSGWWDIATQDAWEQLQNDVDAENVFGRKVVVASEGRSGGWAYIVDITADDVEKWNAVDLAKWAKFARFARETADDVPYQWISLLYYNVFMPQHDASVTRANLDT